MEKRETIRLEMCRLQDEARKLRKQIDAIDNKARQKEIDKWLGKCIRTEYSWIKLDRFNYDTGRYEGTEITQFGRGNGKMIEVKINHWCFESTLKEDKTKVIAESIFRKKLNEARSALAKI